MGVNLVFFESRKLSLAIGNPRFQRLALFSTQVIGCEGLSRDDANPGEAFQQALLGSLRMSERQHEAQVAKQIRRFTDVGFGFRPIDLGGSLAGGLSEIIAQRLNLVTVLDLLDVCQVFFVEQLGAIQGLRDIAFAIDHAVNVRRWCTLPVGPGNHEVAAFIARGASAQISKYQVS